MTGVRLGLVAVLAVGWSALAATPIVRLARRAGVVESAQARLGVRGPRWWPRWSDHPTVSGGPISRVPGSKVVVRALGPWFRHQAQQRAELQIARELPVAVDLLGMAISAGCTPHLAVTLVAGWAPPSMSSWLDAVRRRCVLGAGLSVALSDELPSPQLHPLVDALLATDRYGAPVGDALARLAIEARAGVRRRAETQARTVPVRLLFPLVFLVLPAFVLLTLAPAVLTSLAQH
jgi:tight adherence protein C